MQDQETSLETAQNAAGTESAANRPETPPDFKIMAEEAQKKAAENWDLFLRTRAESDNIRKRATLDVENAHKYGIEKFARELLMVVDSLDQGISLAGNTTTTATEAESESLLQGIKLTHKLLLDILEKFGIKLLDPQGEPFNPNQHEALSTQAHDTLEPNRVLMVAQKGFTLHDRILRPARVIVSRKPETSATHAPLEKTENDPN